MRYSVLGPPFAFYSYMEPPDEGRAYAEVEADSPAKAKAVAYRNRSMRRAVEDVMLPGETPFKYMRAIPWLGPDMPSDHECAGLDMEDPPPCALCEAWHKRVERADAAIDRAVERHAEGG